MNSMVAFRCLHSKIALNLAKQNLRNVSALCATRKAQNSLLSKAIPVSTILSKYTSSDHSHSKLWTAERVLSAALIAVMPASFFVPLPAMDYLFALSVIVHIHWGMEAIVVDYIRPSVFGNVIPKVSLAALYLLSILALGGLFYFNYSDVGVTQAIRMMSKI
ncbi:succinate dehydrogenase [ubiquinone] cytochrome b small subunit: mitochondrial-like protein [Dinothrombium tinctorium]|uniref:Succinate dehydrogenase [ubiquinone] cytochrome b small subunit n=1 Tax=Dinothrombium tinctorium TaxID=1965070 RepID=A0A3S4RGB7_9ACAR|nr:succinate dehydrogenase [ubiquinone] cytochrome b small subunit: mitochondrial-like protein [Dinothrombium tinctorium]